MRTGMLICSSRFSIKMLPVEGEARGWEPFPLFGCLWQLYNTLYIAFSVIKVKLSASPQFSRRLSASEK